MLVYRYAQYALGGKQLAALRLPIASVRRAILHGAALRRNALGLLHPTRNALSWPDTARNPSETQKHWLLDGVTSAVGTLVALRHLPHSVVTKLQYALCSTIVLH